MDKITAKKSRDYYLTSAGYWAGHDHSLSSEGNMVRLERAKVFVEMAKVYHSIALNEEDEPCITGVAIQKGDKIYSLPKPLRHHHLFWQFGEEIGKEGVQGFVTNEGKFLTREEAKVFSGGKGSHETQLFSEDLW